MIYTLFGFTFDVINALIFLVIGFMIAVLTVTSCSHTNKSKKDTVGSIKEKEYIH